MAFTNRHQQDLEQLLELANAKIRDQQAEIDSLMTQLAANTDWIARRLTQGKDYIAAVRKVCDSYERQLDGPPKD